jgi:tRNA modification GTPase
VFSPDDTIVAIATPPGRGGIGVVRISGPQAIAVASAIVTRQAPLEPRRATFTRVRDAERSSAASPVDTVVVTVFPSPHSYTGQDVVEVSAHGSPVVLRTIVRAAVAAGARLARPGEFTLRAFLGGKLDLVQAEAVADLIAAATPLQARVAFDQLDGTLTERIAAIDADLFDLIAKLEASLDFPDEGFHFIEPRDIASRIGAVVEQLDRLLADARRGRMIREGATVVVSGRPNVGKSSLFNKLAGADRAIVTDVPGTTRDLITEAVEIEGIAVTLVDTAGSREALDIVEREGVARGARAREVADLVIVVLDGSEPLTVDDLALLHRTENRPRIIVLSKADRAAAFDRDDGRRVSAVRGDGLEELRHAIASALAGGESVRDGAVVSNLRHVGLLEAARADLSRACAGARQETVPEEILLVDLQGARTCFDEIVGVRTSEDVLRHIFERFCIGK